MIRRSRIIGERPRLTADTGEIPWVADDGLRPGGDYDLPAIVLNTHDRKEEAVHAHGPEAEGVAGRECNQGRPLQPARNSVAPMEAAVIKTGNDPMDKQDTGNEPQRKRRLLAARAHPLARQIGIEPQERCHEHGGENREINPVGEDRDRPGRGKQDHGCQNQEGDRLDVSGSGPAKKIGGPDWSILYRHTILRDAPCS